MMPLAICGGCQVTMMEVELMLYAITFWGGEGAGVDRYSDLHPIHIQEPTILWSALANRTSKGAHSSSCHHTYIEQVQGVEGKSIDGQCCVWCSGVPGFTDVPLWVVHNLIELYKTIGKLGACPIQRDWSWTVVVCSEVVWRRRGWKTTPYME